MAHIKRYRTHWPLGYRTSSAALAHGRRTSRDTGNGQGRDYNHQLIALAREGERLEKEMWTIANRSHVTPEQEMQVAKNAERIVRIRARIDEIIAEIQRKGMEK